MKLDRDNLIRARERRGYSIETVAEVAGIAKNSVLRAEHGEDIRPLTARKIAAALGVEVADLYADDYPKGQAPPNPQPSFNGLLEEERRTEALVPWRHYLTRRVEWCEQVLRKAPDEEYNNPFLRLDTAIQWAIYIEIESTLLHNTIHSQVLPYAESGSEVGAELRALVDRFDAVSTETDARIKTMMDEAGLNEEEKEQIRLRLIEGAA